MSSQDTSESLSRRRFVGRSGAGAAALLLNGALPAALSAREAPVRSLRPAKKFPIGIELYAVRGELARNLPETLRTVSQIGYEVVEFYAPYLGWTAPFAKDVRTQLDDLGLRCYSTHNTFAAITPGDAMGKAIELNQILGARHMIVASPPGRTTSMDDWKRVCGQFTTAVEQLRPHGLFAGFHNHRVEWSPVEGGPRVMDIIAANTPADFVLQFDVGTCLEAGADPVAWIKANPGRIRSVHLKDWAPGTAAQEKGFRVLFTEGVAPWKEIFAAVEAVGGVEFYLMEQEGSRYSEFETAKRCLETWRAMR